MAESVYQNPQITRSVIDGVAVVEAAVPHIGTGQNTKSHLRVIGAEGTSIAGHPVIYSDTYERGNRTIGYARHNVDPRSFLDALEVFLASAIVIEFGELRNRKTRCVVQTHEGIQPLDDITYSAAIAAMKVKGRDLIFGRLNFPFGDITVDFQEEADVVKDEFRFIAEEKLQRRVESPVFVFDLTKSTSAESVWTPFLASIHWAREQVRPEALRNVLRLGARVPALVD